MPDQLQLRGGTTVEHSTFIGASKEVTVDTTKKTVVVHDGTTTGGIPVMREDASNSALGLGSAGTPSIKFTGDLDTGIYSPGANQVAVATNGTGRLFVGATGNVGIGTSTPNVTGFGGATVLTVSNTASSGNAGVIEIQGGSTGNGTLVFLSGAQRQAQIGNELGGSSDLVFYTGGASISEKLRLTSAGRLGIGTSSPATVLQVIGIGAFGNGVGGRLQVTTDSNLGYIDSLNNAGTAFQPLVQRATEIQFHTNTSGTTPTQKAVIDSSGRVGIGTTGPQGKLESATGDSTDYAIVANNSYSSGDQNYISLRAGSTQIGSINRATNDIAIKSFYDGVTFFTGTGGTATQKAKIDSSGRLLVGTSTARSNGKIQTERSDGDIQIECTSNYTSAFLDAPAFLMLSRSGGSSIGSTTIVASGNALGAIRFRGTDGSNLVTAADIRAEIDGTPGTNDMPGRLVFSTTADGAASPTERMRIDNAGRVLVGTATANTSGAKLQTSDGLTFPATQVASADPNTLDDYEEGTSNTAFYGSTTNPTGLSVNGTSYYTKIGRRVSFEYGGNNASWTVAGTGDFYVQVPFICANLNDATYQPMHGINIVHHNGFFNVTNVIAKIEQNSNNVYFYQTGTTTPLTWSNVVQLKFVSMQLTYNTTT